MTGRTSTRAIASGSIVILALLALCLFAGAATAQQDVSDWNDLTNVSDDLDGDYVLTNDLDESTVGYDAVANESANGGDGFQPLGSSGAEFVGTFDGQGHTISNLTINRTGENGVGLFGNAGNFTGNFTIENVRLENVDIVGGQSGTDNSVGKVGGLVGNAFNGTISDVYVSGTVGSPIGAPGPTDTGGVGGAVGLLNAVATTNGYADVNVTATSGQGVGGFAGVVKDSMVNHVVGTGNVTGSIHVGGFAGVITTEANVTESYATGNVTGVNGDAGSGTGGFTGWIDASTIERTYATGNVVADGIDGFNSGTASLVGLINENVGIGNPSTITNSYAVGAVTPDATTGGGLVGTVVTGGDPQGSAINNSYWDNLTTGQTVAVGSGIAGPNVAGFNTTDGSGRAEEMTGADATGNMTQLDFTNTWRTVTGPDDYPRLATAFSLSVSDVTESVTEGDTVTVNGTVFNIAEENRTQTVTLSESVTGSNRGDDTGSLTLSPGDQAQYSLSFTTQGGDAGTGPVTVSSTHDSTSRTIEILFNPCLNPINTPGYHELTTNASSSQSCIEITADNVVYDGHGHTVTGLGLSDDLSFPDPRQVGINVTGENVTVRNVTVDSWHRGLSLVGSDDSTVTDVTATKNIYAGIDIEESSNVTVTDSFAANTSSADFSISPGLSLYNTTGSTVDNVSLQNNQYGLYASGITIGNELQNITTGRNTDQGIDLSYDVRNNTFSNIIATDNGGAGMALYGANNTIVDSIVSNNGAEGMDFGSVSTGDGSFQANNTYVENVTATNNANEGFYLNRPLNVTLEGITATGNQIGVYFFRATGNHVANATLTGNTDWAFADDGFRTVVNTGENIDVGSATLSFEAENVQLRGVAAPPPNAAAQSLGAYFRAESTMFSGSELRDVEFHYDAATLPADIDESSGALWRYDAGANEWNQTSDTGVDTARDVVTANISSFSIFGGFGVSVANVSVSNLQVDTQNLPHTIASGQDRNVSVNITNTGGQSTMANVTLNISNATGTVVEANTSTQVASNETTAVTFGGVTDGLDITQQNYTVTISVGNDSVQGPLAVHPDVTDNGEPARDTTGDGLLDDIGGDGSANIFDVQALFNHLDQPVVQENAALFEFADSRTDRVSIFDIQGLYAGI